MNLNKIILLSSLALCVNLILSLSTLMTKPENLGFSHTTDPTVVKLFWDSPEETDGKITGYYILYTNDKILNDRKWDKITLVGRETTTALKDLVPYIKYYAKIKAIIDETLIGVTSDLIEFETKATVRHNHLSDNTKPKIISITEGKLNGQVNIQWQAPLEPIGLIKQYEIYYTSNKISIRDENLMVKIIDKFAGFDNINEVKECNQLIDGLLHNTTYEFMIKVKTKEDNIGSYSSVFEFKTREEIKDDDEDIDEHYQDFYNNKEEFASMQSIDSKLTKPQNVQISLTSDPTQVSITWDNLEVPNGKISGFYILYSNDKFMDDYFWEKIYINQKRTSIILTNLMPYVTYFVKVICVINGDILGSSSDVIEFETKSSTKNYNRLSLNSKPKIINVVDGEVPSQVEIIWHAPLEATGKITQYEIYYTSNKITVKDKNLKVKIINNIEGFDSINNVKEIHQTLTGLLTNAKYEFLVKVKTNEDNIGSYSSVFEFRTKSYKEFKTNENSETKSEKHINLDTEDNSKAIKDNLTNAYNYDKDKEPTTNKPTNVRVLHFSDPTVVNIVWSAPEETVGKITGYNVLYSADKGSNEKMWQKQQVLGHETTMDLKDLIPYIKYFVKVKAIFDDVMSSSASDVIEFETKSLTKSHSRLSSESKPKIIDVVDGEASSQVEINWQAPSEATGKIIQYEIYYTSNKITVKDENLKVKIINNIEGYDNINNAKEIHQTLTGLLPNTKYEFLVKVKTKEDNIGSYSSVFEFRTKPSNVFQINGEKQVDPKEDPQSDPDINIKTMKENIVNAYNSVKDDERANAKPTNVQVFQSSDPTIVNIKWSAPQETTGKITGYNVLYSADKLLNERKWQKQQVLGQAIKTDLKDLIPYIKYFVKVKAIIDDKVFSSASDVIEFETKSRANRQSSDAKPEIIGVSMANHESEVEILWRAPKYPLGKIIQYEIYYTSNKISIRDSNLKVKIIHKIEGHLNINDVKEMVVEIPGLLTNTRYEFMIKVKTSEDNIGSYSDLYEFKTGSKKDFIKEKTSKLLEENTKISPNKDKYTVYQRIYDLIWTSVIPSITIQAQKVNQTLNALI